jgi:membrane-associated phospholipid phosphatase
MLTGGIESMELALIVIALLAASAGLTAFAAVGLRRASGHGQDLLGAVRWAASRLRQQQRLERGLLLRARARARLRPGWMPGLWVALGLLVVALTAAGASELVEHLTAGQGMALLDHPVARFVAAHRSAALTVVMRLVSSAGGPVVLGTVTAAAGLLLGATWRSWVPVLIVGVTLAGSGGLTLVLKAALSRPRPPLRDALAPADGYAFPSAHAATAAAAFGVLAYLVAIRLRHWNAQVTVWACAAMLTALVGISRVYLGVHWTTDVLGGWAFGLLWLTVILSAWAARTKERALLT